MALEVVEQLEHRGIHDVAVAETLIGLAKKVNDEEDFVAQTTALNINISVNFLHSLFGTIKQKLPRNKPTASIEEVKK